MAFTEQQKKSLSAKLKYRFVKTRVLHGTKLSYVEGWHAISEANRIFGYDCWDRQTVAPRCVSSGDLKGGQHYALYTTSVCITVRAGGETIRREGIGTGYGTSLSFAVAHEVAIKAAETDATKRALATFGNPFGLALYDKEQVGVTRVPGALGRGSRSHGHTFEIRRPDGALLRAVGMTEFRDLVMCAIADVAELDDLYRFWNENKTTFRDVKTVRGGTETIEAIILVLKARAIALRKKAPKQPKATLETAAATDGRLAIPKERRIRNKAHLAFVRQQSCLVCGRAPSHAHHLRFAQRGALGMKVSDEFTVPLCALHHDAIHKVGNERSWWTAQGIDPLKAADALWQQSMAAERTDAAPSVTSELHV